MRRVPGSPLRAWIVGWVLAGWLLALGASAAHGPLAHADAAHDCCCHGHAHEDPAPVDPCAPDPTERETCALCAFLGLAADAPPAAPALAISSAPAPTEERPAPTVTAAPRFEPGRPRGPPIPTHA